MARENNAGSLQVNAYPNADDPCAEVVRYAGEILLRDDVLGDILKSRNLFFRIFITNSTRLLKEEMAKDQPIIAYFLEIGRAHV